MLYLLVGLVALTCILIFAALVSHAADHAKRERTLAQHRSEVAP